MKTKNIITMSDSYKFLNNAFLKDVLNVLSYFEARNGAKYLETVFFGLQYLLKEYLVGQVVTQKMIEDAKIVAKYHLGGENKFNIKMWQYIVDNYDGKLPIEIKAVPEGMSVPIDNVLMTITCTDESGICAGLVNHLETLLTNVWSSCLVATKSKFIKSILLKYAEETCDGTGHIRFQLHDFAQRSVKCPEAASFTGVGHLVNFYGTDTVLAWENARDYYNGNVETIGFSVFATEHNFMMYRGVDGEEQVVREILENEMFKTGIISVLGDTYNIYNFVSNIMGKTFKNDILNRDGVFVVRPDSVTPTHDTPETMTLWIINELWNIFGGTVNAKGYKVLDKHVRCIYGDGLNTQSITNILELLMVNGFSSENVVFGCGHFLLDEGSRDTQRNAYKSSSMNINGVWTGIFKNPLGSNKKSKKGRMKLVRDENGLLKTLTEYDEGYEVSEDILVTVFKNGDMVKDWTLDEIRERNNF